jgi:iron complex transport system ATP-binding protein
MQDEAALRGLGLRVTLGGKRILDDVDIAVARGNLVVIAGPNGAGKSTLLRSLLGLSRPDAGEVYCSGTALDKLTRLERARRIAYVPQSSQLDAALTVTEVVGHARFAHGVDAAADARRIDGVLRRVGIAELAQRSYLSLSGGERRLALIARALGTGARTICLDEPTACLDIYNRLRCLGLLRELADHDHAIVCVLHELEDVRRFADQVVLLQHGRVYAAGPPDRVITRDTVRAVYGVELHANDALGFRLSGAAS